MSPSVHVDDRKKDILILAEGPKQRLDNTKVTAEKKHSDNIAVTRKEFCLGCIIKEKVVIYLLFIYYDTAFLFYMIMLRHI